jgi:pimeloyl-ACP methyl ester carboxylesterase
MNTEPSDLKTLNAAGQEFDYLDVGSGKPVLLLHGALGDLRTFTPHCRMLADQYRAITYTQRYFGKKEWPEIGPPFGTETHAHDLVAFVEALGIGPVYLVAWSYAGHVALRAAQLRPDLFQALFAYETGYQTFMTDAEEIAAFKTDTETLFAPVFAAVNDGDNEKATKLLVNGSARDEHYFVSRTALQIEIEIDNAHTMPKLLSQSPPPRISADDLAAIQVPVTIACGEKSRPAYKLVSEAAMRILPGPHYMIPGVNHFWPDAEPSAFTDFIHQWLASKA